jgi:hypothetical protein
MAAADQHSDPSSRIYDFTVHLAQEGELVHPAWVGTELVVVQLATLPDNGLTGGYFHLGERLPW